MKRICICMAVVLCLLLYAVGAAAQAENTPVFSLPVGSGTAELRAEWIEEECWLFLPAFARLENVEAVDALLEWDDMESDADGVWHANVLAEDGTIPVSVMRSANLRAMFLFSDDPENAGRAYIEESPDHETCASGSMALVDTDGNVNHAEKIIELRGRGNWTWNWDKRPYQMKLEKKADLLDTGDRANRARTWVLLAEALDGTLLHNRMTADLARELGLPAMDSEFVDLYYDGSYRGTYLLSEKVQVGEGRIDVLDYDELLETWNNKVGQYDLEALPVQEALNRFGNSFTYVEGVVENNQPHVGSFFVEMESAGLTLSDRCYFTLNGGGGPVYALKNPENASRKMMTYISEKLQEARNTLKGGGINPETGFSTEDVFDVDAYARTMLMHEWSYNIDGFSHSSSYFILPAGEDCFLPGPVWDFDLAYRYYRDGRNAGAAGWKEDSGWMPDFYSVPAFLQKVKTIYLEEFLPLVENVLLGKEESRYLQSLDAYEAWLAPSAAMNSRLWGMIREGRFSYGDSFANDLDMMRHFIRERSAWLKNALTDLKPDNPKHIPLWMTVSFTNPDDSIVIHSAPWQDVSVSVLSTEELTEATEEEYARWNMEAVVSGVPDACTVSLNGTSVTLAAQEDGTWLLRAEYEDRSYRPVDYLGDDVGLIYNHDAYVQRYPEVAQACENDPEAIMDYFFDEGMYEGHVGNGLFDPREVAVLQPHVANSLYDDWMSYYWEFLTWGYDAEWMQHTMARFVPEVWDAP